MTKANLILDNEKAILNGYVNIDPFMKGKSGGERVEGDVITLDYIFDDGELDQLIARHILEYFPLANQGNILHNWLKKIKRGGEFIYEQTDFESVCLAFASNKINAKEAQTLLFGSQDKAWNIKKSGLSLLALVDFLQGSGFKVMQKRWENLNFCVKAVRL